MILLAEKCLKQRRMSANEVRPCLNDLGHDVGVDCTLHYTFYRGKKVSWPLVTTNGEDKA